MSNNIIIIISYQLQKKQKIKYPCGLLRCILDTGNGIKRQIAYLTSLKFSHYLQ